MTLEEVLTSTWEKSFKRSRELYLQGKTDTYEFKLIEEMTDTAAHALILLIGEYAFCELWLRTLVRILAEEGMKKNG